MSSEASGLERVLGTVNMVCGGLMLGWAGVDLYHRLFGMGWSDVPARNLYFFTLTNLHPWFNVVLDLRIALRFLVSIAFLAAGLALKQDLAWSMKACVLAAALVLVFGFANLAYCMLVLNPAVERALLASSGSIPEGLSRGALDLYVTLRTLPFMIYVIVLLVVLRLHRSY